MSTRTILIFGGIALAGLLQVVLAHWLGRKTRALVARGKRAPGRLVGATTRSSDGDGSSRHDVIEFTTEDGRRGEVTSRIGVPWSTYAGKQGKPIMVLYDPANLEDAVIDRWIELWAAPAILVANGGLMIVAAGALALLAGLGVLDP